MKKTFNLIICALIMSIAFCSCEKNQAAYKEEIEFTTYTFGNMMIDIPKEWENDLDECYYFYTENDDMLMLFKDAFNGSYNEFDQDDFVEYKEGIKENTENYNEIISDTVTVNDILMYHLIYKSEHDGKNVYNNEYVFVDAEYLYCIHFASYGNEQCIEFNQTYNQILDSILIFDNDLDNIYDNNDELENEETELPTYIKDEPITEITDQLTMLYNDKNIEVYYYNFEKGDNDSNVTFLIQNNTDKQLVFQCDTITLNGYSYNKVIMSDPVAPKTRGFIECKIDSQVLLEEISSVGVSLRYFDEIVNSTVNEKIVIPEKKLK